MLGILFFALMKTERESKVLFHMPKSHLPFPVECERVANLLSHLSLPTERERMAKLMSYLLLPTKRGMMPKLSSHPLLSPNERAFVAL